MDLCQWHVFDVECMIREKLRKAPNTFVKCNESVLIASPAGGSMYGDKVYRGPSWFRGGVHLTLASESDRLKGYSFRKLFCCI